MQPRKASTADIPELIRLRAVALESLGTDPGPVDTPWRLIARDWFDERINRRDDCVCLVAGGDPGEPLLACGMAWVTYHLPGSRWPDGRRGYLDGIVTDTPARAPTPQINRKTRSPWVACSLSCNMPRILPVAL
ncbi:hypothetical protein ABZ646_40480, partial [Streptomyces sp. NPDC007162]